MPDVRSVLERVHGQLTPPDDSFDRLLTYRSHRRRRQGLIAAAVALVVAASGIGLVVWAFSPGKPPQPGATERTVSPEPTLSPDQQSSTPMGPLPAANPRIAWTEPVGPEGQTPAILFAEGSLWVSYYEGSGGSEFLARVDPETGETVARIEAVVPGWVSGGGGLTAGYGDIWVTGTGGGQQEVVQRIDPVTNQVISTIPIGGRGADIAVGADAVWVAFSDDDHSGVARINPATNQVVATIPIESNYVRWIAASDDAVIVLEYVWGGGPPDPCGVLTSIDPTTNAVRAHMAIDDWSLHDQCGSTTPVAWQGSVWGSSFDGLYLVDPATARLVGEPIPYDEEHGPRSFVLPNGREVWFAAYPGSNGGPPDTLARLDSETGEIEYFEAVQIGGTATMDPDTIWVLDYDGNVTRIDLR
jgi:hypothetical protein